MSMTESDSEPLGVTVCRLSLDPARGRIRHPHQVGIAIRAAMFTELALAGRLVGGPGPRRSASPTPAPTCWTRCTPRWPAAGRPGGSAGTATSTPTATAATKALVESGRWKLEGRRIVDSDPGSTVVDQQSIRAVLLRASRRPS